MATRQTDTDLRLGRNAALAQPRSPIADVTGLLASPLGIVVGMLVSAAVLVAVGRTLGLNQIAAAETFVIVFTSLVVEAIPFVLLGATVAAAIEVFVPQRLFSRIARLPVALQLPVASAGALAFPVCECGSVPVARRLMAKGMAPAAGIAFMLAAPAINPVVLASTWVAYEGRGNALEMTLGRAAVGLFVAVVAGVVIGRLSTKSLLRERPASASEAVTAASRYAHDHGQDALDADGCAISATGSKPRKGRLFAAHVADDFLFMGRYLVIGAALAAVIQVILPQDIITGLGDLPVLSTLALMGLAFVMALCSEADAFVAISFTQFRFASQLGFLNFGPIVDTKLLALYGATFTRGFIRALLPVAIITVVAATVVFGLFVE